MAKDTQTRIEERNRLSEWHSRRQNVLSRGVGTIGRVAANTWDRITGPFESDGAAFAEGTAFGVTKGIVTGGTLGVLAALFVGGVAGYAAIAVPYALAAATVGAVYQGIRYGQGKLDRHLQKPHHRFSDTIAETLGAVPTEKALMNDKVQVLTPKYIAPPPPAEDAPTHSFAEAERQRRAARRGPTILNP